MTEFRPMAVLHADLVGPIPPGKNARNQRGLQFILSVVDSATRYLWLLPLRHKTAGEVAAALCEEVTMRISVPSAILTDQGGEFTGDVVRRVCERLGITRLRTSGYRPQTDSMCERVHYSIQNMIAKLVDDQHEYWPDLLGPVALAYNSTVHGTTGYCPHELFTLSDHYARWTSLLMRLGKNLPEPQMRMRCRSPNGCEWLSHSCVSIRQNRQNE